MEGNNELVLPPAKRARCAKSDDDEDEHGIPAEMKDFIVPDTEEVIYTAAASLDDNENAEELCREAASVTQGAAGLVVNEQGLRRSARANKGVPPAPFVQEGFRELMLDDADVDDVFNDSADDASIHTSDDEETEGEGEEEETDETEPEDEDYTEDVKSDKEEDDDDEEEEDDDDEEEDDDDEEEDDDDEATSADGINKDNIIVTL